MLVLLLAGLRPGIRSWFKFQPEDEGDGKVILPRRKPRYDDVPAPSSSGWNLNQEMDEQS